MTTVNISFGGQSITIEYENEVNHSLINYLFNDLIGKSGFKPLSRLRVVHHQQVNQSSLWQDKNKIYYGNNKTLLAITLLERALCLLTEKNTSGLAFHAAGLYSDEQGILIPGASGAGKSSLCAWLTNQGLNYLTDELVHITLDTHTMEGFTRPINIKNHGFGILSEFVDLEDENIWLKNEQACLIPYRLLNSNSQIQNPKIKLILFPNIVSAPTQQRLTRLSKAQAGLRLIASLVNARNLDNHGFDQITDLVRNADAYEITYCGFKSLPRLLKSAIPSL